MCAWAIWPSSARTRSTASRRCTANSIKETVFRDFHKLYPDRIVNKTNGVTFRRWLLEANPSLSNLLAQTIGPQVFDDPTHLAELERFADDSGFQQRFAAAKRANKERLAQLIFDRVDCEGLAERAVRRADQAHSRI